MDAVPGLLVKSGAEGVQAFALAGADGEGARSGAIKIDDGMQRACTPLTAAILGRLGVQVPDELATVPIPGGNGVVGAVNATLPAGG